MANKNYTYPRVSILSEARKHSSVQPAVGDTTVMFAPITTEKGPDKEVVRIHSLSEFIETFGNLSYERNGQMALNIYNWLMNGGTVYVYRLAGYAAVDEPAEEDNAKKAVIKTTDASLYEDVIVVGEENFKNNMHDIEDILKLFDEIPTGEDKIYYIFNREKEILYTVNSAEDNIQESITPFVNKKDVKEEALEATNYYFYSDDIYYKENGSPEYSSKQAEGYEKLANASNGLCLHYANTNEESVIKYQTENKTDVKVIGEAKYFGEYYNTLRLNVKVVSNYNGNKTFNINVIKVSEGLTTVVERFPRLTLNNYKSAIISSEYIGANFDLENELANWINNASEGSENTYIFGEANDRGINNDIVALERFYKNGDFAKNLSNVIETPIDIMFDAGYPKSIKEAMLKVVSATSPDAVRPDIVCIFDNYELTVGADGKRGYLSIPGNSGIDSDTTQYFKANNIAFYDQYFTVNDQIFTGQNIYVTPTYFLSKLIAYNDMNYGIQFPTAGVRRGVLDDALAVNYNPNADEKESLFINRINYVEKTPREYAFMNQRTHDGSSAEAYTALSFLNNVRVLEKMKKELERLGRNYLFEFNDSITLTQLSDVLNKYVMNWISNRTLATGVVTVERNPYSDEAVDINLTIRFNGTIEVISVQITIE